jgi:hypothetical protein
MVVPYERCLLEDPYEVPGQDLRFEPAPRDKSAIEDRTNRGRCKGLEALGDQLVSIEDVVEDLVEEL